MPACFSLSKISADSSQRYDSRHLSVLTDSESSILHQCDLTTMTSWPLAVANYLLVVEGQEHDCLRGKESSGGPSHFWWWELWSNHSEILHFQRRYDTSFGLDGHFLSNLCSSEVFKWFVSLCLRPGWHLQLCRLHHLSWWRWNFAVCIFTLPGTPSFTPCLHLSFRRSCLGSRASTEQPVLMVKKHSLFHCRRAFRQLWHSTWAPSAFSHLSNLTPISLRSPKLLKVCMFTVF